MLLADDTAMIRRAVRRVIEDTCEGVRVVGEAKDYTELILAIEALKPDVVLMDVHMPDESSIEAAEFRAHLHPRRCW